MNGSPRSVRIVLTLLVAVVAACQGTASSPGSTPIQAATVTDDWLEPLCDALENGSAGFNYLQDGATSLRRNDLENASAAGRLATRALRAAEEIAERHPAMGAW